jgi:NAD(P)-dependent dehydrogenase (short-subunit alcohol dehydrogenase family)
MEEGGLHMTEKKILQGKVAIVTGATSGFGRAIAFGLAKHGALIAGCASHADFLDSTTAEITQETGSPARFFQVDIREETSAQLIVDSTMEAFGRIDIVIINAGAAKRFEKPYLELSLPEVASTMREQYQQFAVHTTLLALAAAKQMISLYKDIGLDEMGHLKDSGNIIVNLGAVAFQPIRDDLLAYGAAKRAAVHIIMSMAGVFGQYNIRVNGIAPGYANTERPRKFYERMPQIRADIGKHNIIKPAFQYPASVVPAILYILQDHYLTGEFIRLDGGWHLRFNRYFNK